MRTSLTRAIMGGAAGAALLTSVAACERSSQQSAGSGSGTTAPAVLPANLFLASEPADVKSVHDAKGAAKKGDRIVVRGRIGGSEEPFIAERAIFTIVDHGVKSCGEMDEKDHCPTPWDYCCEPRDNLVANSATIQVVGPDGKPLKTGFKGVRGLVPLAEVWVVGTVSQRDEGAAGTFVVNAEGVWVKPG